MLTHTTSSIARTIVFFIAMTVAARGEASAQPAEKPEAAPPAAAEKAAPPAATPAAKPDAAKCERYVTALAGGEKDAAAKQPEALGLGSQAVDLVTCNAVRADSDDPCKVLDKDQAEACRVTRATYHEIRAYPNGRSYMFDDRKYQECKQSGGLPVVVCDALRKALRAGDPSQCVMEADFVALCRQAVKDGNLQGVDAAGCTTEGPTIRKMLEGQCRALVNLDPAACDIPGPHAEGMAEQCRKDIESRGSFGKGLKELAKSDSLRDRELAKAALDDPSACKDLVKSANEACRAAALEPASETGGGGDAAAPGAPEAPPSAPKEDAAPGKG